MSPSMGDTGPALDTAHLLEALEACLAGVGRDVWADAFVDLTAMTGAAQVMIFSYAPGSAACLLSRNFLAGALGHSLASDYLSGWFREDPLYRLALALPAGDVRRVDSREVSPEVSAEYRARFYERPRLAGKQAILVAGARLKLAVNFYWPTAGEPPGRPRLEPVLARLALLHFEARSEHAYPAPLAVLSEREREVCLGILSGKKAEAIAGDLGVAGSTVVTYRSRAYQKLGISSRGTLFALCAR